MRSRSATSRSCRRRPAPPATSSRCISISAACRSRSPTPPACARLERMSRRKASRVRWPAPRTRIRSLAGRCHRSVWEPPASLADQASLLSFSNKIDLAPDAGAGQGDAVAVSAKTGAGARPSSRCWKRRRRTGRRCRRRWRAHDPRPPPGRAGGSTRCPRRASAMLRAAPELKAEELRIAARHLGRLTGRIDVEEVLGDIFAEFCIGK